MHEVTPAALSAEMLGMRIIPSHGVCGHRQAYFSSQAGVTRFDASSSCLRNGRATDCWSSLFLVPLPREERCPFWTRFTNSLLEFRETLRSVSFSSIRWSTSSFERRLDQTLVPRSLLLGCLRKRMVSLRHARHMSLSSRVMDVFWNVLISTVQRAVNVPGNTLFQQLELADPAPGGEFS